MRGILFFFFSKFDENVLSNSVFFFTFVFVFNQKEKDLVF